jgi:hypothetical protein
VARVIEEEWSYIPVGGPLPVAGQPVTAFGAAANLIHPATGYSIARRRAPPPAHARLPGTMGSRGAVHVALEASTRACLKQAVSAAEALRCDWNDMPSPSL